MAAEWAVAIGTLLLAAMTGWLGWQNRSLVKAARLEAQKVADEVTTSREMLEEVKRDRQLNWQPYLTSVREFAATASVHVSNIGRGPALRALYFERTESGGWLLSRGRMAVPADNKPHALALQSMVNPAPTEVLSSGEPEVVLICNDQFGNWLKFAPRQGEPEIWPRDELPRPGWANWFQAAF